MNSGRYTARMLIVLGLTLAVSLGWVEPASGEGEYSSEAAEVEKPTAQPAQVALPGPKYKNMRQDEDYSYLDGPEGSYTADVFDPIKYMHLGDDWRLSIGGELKGRWESFNNDLFGSRTRTHDAYFLHRYMLHTDLKYRKVFRLFFQGITAFAEDRDFPLRAIDENRWDFQQLFFDLRPLGEDVPLTVRVGRQDLNYGSERLISTLDWANTRRRFDAVKLFWHEGDWQIDMFYAKPTAINLAENLNRRHDTYNEDFDLYGLWVTYTGIANHGIETYFLAVDDTGAPVNANGRRGDRSVYTIGGRFWGKPKPWDYDAELAGQWGTFAGDTVQAWMFSAKGGYTFANCPMTPRLGLGFDWATGDENPRDSAHQTFFQLFPFGHYYLGFIDLVGRQNIIATRADVSFKPHKKVKVGLTYHAFFLDESADALYNAGGGVVRRGGGEHEVGHELDTTIVYKFDRHTSFLFGWSHLWPGTFIETTGASEDVDFFYVQYAYKF